MVPTLLPGDLLLVTRHRVPRGGDVIVCRLPPDGVVSVKRAVSREPSGWWVERDNPREGSDSWSVGSIPDEDVLGVVRLRLWPRPGRVAAR